MRWAGLVVLMCFCAGGVARGDALRPEQRQALLASGVVSPTVLDAIRSDNRVRVIISYREPPVASPAARDGAHHRAAMARRSDAILAGLSHDQFRLRRRFVSLPAIAGSVDLAGLQHLARDPNVNWIEPSLGGGGALAESLPLTRTVEVAAQGFSGQGVRVAVLDSGADTAHQDLAGVVVEERCWCEDDTFNGCCPNGNTIQTGPGAAADDNGHGTHIAGIIASNGTIAPGGAAPAVEIVAIKVLDESNRFYFDDDILDALDWINTQSTAENPYVDIVNMSLATSLTPGFGVPCNPGVGSGPWAMGWTNAVKNLTDKGILVVAASGNDGVGSVAPAPACVQESFSVAASWDADFGSPFSWSLCTDPNSGADAWTCFSNAYDNGLAKTDVVAPGAWITSSWPGGAQLMMAGTSQATPHVTGCAALVLEANAGNPSRTLADLEADLRTSPTSVVSLGASFGSSFPRLDCAAALPEPRAALQSLALLFGLAVAARRFSPSRQPARRVSSWAKTALSG